MGIHNGRRYRTPIRAGRDGWAVLLLHERAQGVEVASLELDWHRYLPDAIFYVPAARAGRLAVDHPLNSYAFVVASNPGQILKLDRSRYIEGVLCVPQTRTVVLVSDAEMAALMRAQAGDDYLRQGSQVRITAGDAAGLDGVILSLDAARARVRIDCTHATVLDVARNELIARPT